ncbi:NADH-cytochrome b5 reductase 3-like [Ornithodoros turicata]|uniref:NADH-cytochrome b5 reductase 3-like n=1 Tax=Ornithodoros turicata TaxID=34597 RepID=UPI003139D588
MTSFLHEKWPTLLGHHRLLTALAFSGFGLLMTYWGYVRYQRRIRTGRLLLIPNSSYKVTLLEREVLTHNTRLLRFALPYQGQTLGLPVGKHIYVHAKIKGRLVVRPYTPISHTDQRGSFDIIVKVYFKETALQFPGGGTMSQFLDSLQPGDSVHIQGPKGSMEYKGRGVFSFKDGLIVHKVARIGMIAGGSGITPMLQLLRCIFNDTEDNTQVNLIFVNHTEDDIILRYELDDLAHSYPSQFHIFYVVNTPPAGWRYGSGLLNVGHIRENLPPAGQDTLILLCGPPLLVSRVCRPALSKLGYTASLVYAY